MTPRPQRRASDGRNADVLIAFDFGSRRIGVATANLHTRTATPLTTLDVGRDLPWDSLDAVIADWRPGRLLVGLPQGSDGAEAVAKQVRRFVGALIERYRIPVETVDESLTSAAASSELREGRKSGLLRRRVRKDTVDRYAACHIAEQWMADAPRDA